MISSLVTKQPKLTTIQHISLPALYHSFHITSTKIILSPNGTFWGMVAKPIRRFISTCDLYDEYLDTARVPTLLWRSFGGKKSFHGQVSTVKCFEDNSRIKELVESPGQERVLVVDAGGSLRCAVLGDILAATAARNQWAGLVVLGCVRDVQALANIDLGVMALGCTPRKSTRRGEGQTDIAIRLGDVDCHPGDHIFCDLDGVLLLNEQQSEELLNNRQD